MSKENKPRLSVLLNAESVVLLRNIKQMGKLQRKLCVGL